MTILGTLPVAPARILARPVWPATDWTRKAPKAVICGTGRFSAPWGGTKGPISGTVLYGGANVPTEATVILFTGTPQGPVTVLQIRRSLPNGTWSFDRLAAGTYWVMEDGAGLFRNAVFGPFVLT